MRGRESTRTDRGEPRRTEERLECTECETTHTHTFYEPAPSGTVNLLCPNCGEHQDLRVLG